MHSVGYSSGENVLDEVLHYIRHNYQGYILRNARMGIFVSDTPSMYPLSSFPSNPYQARFHFPPPNSSRTSTKLFGSVLQPKSVNKGLPSSPISHVSPFGPTAPFACPFNSKPSGKYNYPIKSASLSGSSA